MRVEFSSKWMNREFEKAGKDSDSSNRLLVQF